MVRSSFSILFAIRESKARKSGKAPIEITITVYGERCTLSTGKQVPIDKWDKAKQQVKGKDEEAQSLNNYLKAIKAKLYQKEAELLEGSILYHRQAFHRQTLQNTCIQEAYGHQHHRE